MTPKTVTDAEVAFPARVDHLLPAWTDIPSEFKNSQNYWVDLVETWFFKGLNGDEFTVKPGVDEEFALRHLKAIMRSYNPKHEHKIAGVAYLMSLWFEVAA